MNWKWIPPAALAGLVCILAVAARKSSRAAKGKAPAGERPVLFAHRGASATFPENTIAAFEAGLTSGATHLEMDVHMTCDGHITVIHDDTLERTTNGSGFVRDMTLAELQSLDAGHHFSPDGLVHPFRGQSIRVPTLGEVFRKFPGAVINLEIKEKQPGIEEAVLREIEAAGAGGRTVVAATKHGIMRRFRRLAGERVATAASRREIRFFFLVSKLWLEGFLRPSYTTLQVPPEYRGVRIITRRFLEAARRRGVRVDAWTINDPEEMRRLLALGVGGIMSDRPGMLAQALGEANVRAENSSG